MKIYLEQAQLQKTDISPSQKQHGLQAVAQHIQTHTDEDGVNALPDLLLHTDNGLAALSYTNPLHRHLNLLLNHFNILLCIMWQLLVFSNICYIGLPARERDVLHLHTPKFCCVGREKEQEADTGDHEMSEKDCVVYCV